MTDIFGTPAPAGGGTDIFGAPAPAGGGGTDIFSTPGPAPAAGGTDIFGTPAPAPAPAPAGGGTDIFGNSTPAPAPAGGGTDIFGNSTPAPAPAGGTDIFGAPAPAPSSSSALSFGTDIFGAPAPAPAAAGGGAEIGAGGYDIKPTKEKVEYHVPTFLADIENHFREMGYAEGTGGGFQDFTHVFPVDRAMVGSAKPLTRSDKEVRSAVGEERWKEKSKLLGNTQQISLQYNRGITAFADSVVKLERKVSTGIDKMKLLEKHVQAVKAKIEKVEIDYTRSYDLQKYLHRRVLVVLANKDLIGAQSHDGPEEAVFNDKVEQLAKQVRVTENFRARIERLQFAQQRQSATKPQYEASIPSDTRRTLVSHLQKQKNILSVLSDKIATIKKDMRIIRQWQREKRQQQADVRY